MRDLTYYVGTTLDGFIAGPQEQIDFFPLSGDHMAGITATCPETVPGHLRAMAGIDGTNRLFDTVLMGRGTYQPALREGITSPYPHLRQVVFSRSMRTSPDPAVELVTGDPVARIREFKAEAGLGIWLAGGGTLAGVVWPEIDRFVLKIYPVMAGSGIRLADRPFDPTRLRLTDRQQYDSGALVVTYEPMRG